MVNNLRKTVEKMSKSVLTNKYVLYATLIVAIMNVVGYLATHNFVSLTIFALIGLLTSHFTNNMTVILLVTIIVAAILHLSRRTVEAMTNKSNSDGDGDGDGNSDGNNEKNEDDSDNESEDENENEQSSSSGSSNNATSVKDEPVMTTPSKINHQATVEASYKNINNILGDKKFKKMTKDTNTLIAQQKNLTESLQAMTPLLQSAQGMLKDINVEGINDMLSSFAPASQKKE